MLTCALFLKNSSLDRYDPQGFLMKSRLVHELDAN